MEGERLQWLLMADPAEYLEVAWSRVVLGGEFSY